MQKEEKIKEIKIVEKENKKKKKSTKNELKNEFLKSAVF